MSSPNIVYATHDFEAENEDEITFKCGEPIVILQNDDQYMDGWWYGRNIRDETGLFPINYTSPEKPTATKSSASTVSSMSSNSQQGSEQRQLRIERLASYSKGEDDAVYQPTHRVSSGTSSSTTSSSTNLPTPVDNPQVIYKHSTFATAPSLTANSSSIAWSKINTNSDHNLTDTIKSSPENWNMDDVVHWLQSVGLQSVIDNFIDQEITGDVLLCLDHEALKELGITAYGRRYKVMNAIKALKASIEDTNNQSSQSSYSSTISNADTYNQSQRQTQNYSGGGQQSSLHQTSNNNVIRYGSVTEHQLPNVRCSNAISSLNTPVVSPTASAPTAAHQRTGHSSFAADGYFNRNSIISSGATTPNLDDARYPYNAYGIAESPSPIRSSMMHSTTNAAAAAPNTPERSIFQNAIETTPASIPQQQQHQRRSMMLLYYNSNNSATLSSSSTTISSSSSSLVHSNTASSHRPSVLDTHHRFNSQSQSSSPQQQLQEPLLPPPQQPLPQQPHHQDYNLALCNTISKNANHFPEFEGWLYKQSDRYKTWNKRWFVLYGTNLFYFKNPKDMRMKGIIHLHGYRVIVEEKKTFHHMSSSNGVNSHNSNTSHRSSKYNSKRNYFKLHHDHERTFYFYTSDANEMRKWVQVLLKSTIKRDLCVPVVSSNNIETVPLEIAQKMKPRPPSALMYNHPPIQCQKTPSLQQDKKNEIRQTLVLGHRQDNPPQQQAIMDDELLDETLLWMEHPNGNGLEEPLQKLIIRSYPSLAAEEDDEEVKGKDVVGENKKRLSMLTSGNSSTDFLDRISCSNSNNSTCYKQPFSVTGGSNR
ncbi:hypothetical protein BDF20DRAFT_997490 [Mycotypha africana]|uniref:uncharacterized protein n=1 Tax=Mycotypha africana TaxID=64632 RepID=UPI002301838B|nr:uncharacterized protein BDF20DRAFT_997490 [Mycotypha africana]KAI8991665.1 hypothetical protein BDF20DRAFT_997490 [Mycotypha africana]